jgi:hypothetical protein
MLTCNAPNINSMPLLNLASTRIMSDATLVSSSSEASSDTIAHVATIVPSAAVDDASLMLSVPTAAADGSDVITSMPATVHVDQVEVKIAPPAAATTPDGLASLDDGKDVPLVVIAGVKPATMRTVRWVFDIIDDNTDGAITFGEIEQWITYVTHALETDTLQSQC